MDVLYAVKKYLAFILVLTVLFGALGFLYATSKNNSLDSDTPVSVEKTEIAVSELYLVSGEMQGDYDKNQLQFNRDIALMISSMLNAEYTRQRVYETVISEIDVDSIINSDRELEEKYSDKILKNDFIGEFVNVAVLENTSIVRIHVHSYSEQFASRLLELYKAEFENAAVLVNNGAAKCSYASVADTKIGVESEEQISIATGVSTKKYAVIFAFFGAALSVCAVFAYTLFFPVINRRCDAEGYGTAMIADKKDPIEFAIHNISRAAKAKNAEKIAFVVCESANEKTQAQAYYDAFVKKAAELSFCTEIEICFDAANDYEAFKTAEKCSNVVILVSYSNTKHTEYQKTVARMTDNGIDILGCAAI